MSLARLDDVMPVSRRVDLIKIDVEGAEVRVLRGAARLLGQHKPALWLEHGERSAGVHGTTRRQLWDLLREYQYRVFTADGEGPLDWDAFDSERVKRLWTFLAR